jgi:hypothetical protein
VEMRRDIDTLLIMVIFQIAKNIPFLKSKPIDSMGPIFKR